MAEHMTFLPKKNLLSLDELLRVSRIFVKLGVNKIRITGGEPLVRRDVMFLFNGLGNMMQDSSLHELTLTTNATQLHKYAQDLVLAGVKRINVSLDTVDPAMFNTLTRWGKIETVLKGIHVALNAGLKVKINAVALASIDFSHTLKLVDFCAQHKLDLTFIEVMPMGDIGNEQRTDQYLPLSSLKKQLTDTLTLTPSNHSTGGPASYMNCAETGARIGFIAPQTANFCSDCNRVRMTCTGTVYTCLGQSHSAELLPLLRDTNISDNDIAQVLIKTVADKKKGHNFLISKEQTLDPLDRHMNVTGG
jgi:cyclic pyranopterin phosphate synthase